MNKDVEEYIKTCAICQKTKHSTQKPPGLLKPINADYPWQIVTMDFVGGFAPGRLTGNNMCLVMVDKFSKYIILESVPETVDSEQTANILIKRLISQFGIPEKIITDRGPQFSANLWQKVLEFLGSKSALSTAHHPQTDGQSERAIQTVTRLISTFASEEESKWEELLPMFQFALNDAFCESISSTPFRVLYGCDPVSPMRLITEQSSQNASSEQSIIPLDWEEKTFEQLTKVWEFIKEHQEEVAQRMKSRYDRNRQPREFKEGDMVLVSTKSHRLLEGHRKHRQKHVGPYLIERKINENAYKLSGLPPGMPSTQNVQYLTPFNLSPPKFRTRPTPEANVPEIIDGEPEWEVEEILNDRSTRGNGNFRYLVKWANTPQKQWLPLECLNNCCEILRQYYIKNNKEIPIQIEEFLKENDKPNIPPESEAEETEQTSPQTSPPDPPPTDT